MAPMHPDIKKLNKDDPPPPGCRHPAYEVTGKGNCWYVSYINEGKWLQPVRSFPNESSAYRYILDVLYYGEALWLARTKTFTNKRWNESCRDDLG